MKTSLERLVFRLVFMVIGNCDLVKFRFYIYLVDSHHRKSYLLSIGHL